MRKITLFTAFLLFSYTLQSQVKKDYDDVMLKITESFNSTDSEKMFSLFTDELKSSLPVNELKTILDTTFKDKGKLSSYDLIVEETDSNTYLVELENASMLFLVKLSPDLKLSTFKIEEY